MKIALPILVIIILPLVLAFFTQKLLKKKHPSASLEAIKHKFGVFSNLGLVMIVFVLMGIKQNIIIFEQPELIFLSFIPLLAFYVLSYVISMAVYSYKGGSEGRAMVWGTYLRYITLALGLTTSLIYQNPSYSVMAIIIILSYLIQIPSSFLLTKILNNHNL